MALITEPAFEQISSILDSYISEDDPDKAKPEAAEKLIEAVEEAMRRMDAGPPFGTPYPATYQRMQKHNLRWFKVHRYWFAYKQEQGQQRPVVVQVLFDQANMPKRLVPEGPAFEYPEAR